MTETAKKISKIARAVLKDSGFSADANASGGRCYEFRDELASRLKEAKIKCLSTDNGMWLREAYKLKIPVGWAETTMLEWVGNEHAWVYCDGKHYDALNPEGVASPKLLKFYARDFKDGRYDPDEEEIAYKRSKGYIYNKKTDQFVKNGEKAGVNDYHLYHICSPHKALNILKLGELFLPLAETNKSESDLALKGKLYYLSFARTPASGYIADRSKYLRAINDDVLLVFDRRKLAQLRGVRFRSVSYFASDAYGRQSGAAREAEDRLFSNRPTLPCMNALVEVRLVVRDAADKINSSNGTKFLRSIVLLCKSKRIPLKLFTDNNKTGFVAGVENSADRTAAYTALRDRSIWYNGERPQKAYTSLRDHVRPTGPTQRRLGAAYQSGMSRALSELVFKNQYNALSKRARDIVSYYIARERDPSTLYRHLDSDLHNMRNRRDADRILFEKLLTHTRVRTLGEFINLLFDKWQRLYQVYVDEYNARM